MEVSSFCAHVAQKHLSSGLLWIPLCVHLCLSSLVLLTVSKDAAGSHGNCCQGSRVSCISELVSVCWPWMRNRSTWSETAARGRGVLQFFL